MLAALPDLALRLVRKLCDGSHRSREIVGAHDILIIPLLNVRGRKRVESELDSSSCADLSKNGNLVDINANFDVGWTYASANPSAADYRGPLAAQEEETKLLKALGSTWGPRVFIDVQSADSSALAHARWSSVAAPDQLDKLNSCVDQVARHTAGLCQNNSYPGTNECPKVGSASMATLPPGKLFGTALDWFDSQEGVLAFLFSTFSGSQSAASHITHAPTTTRLSQVGENGLSSLVRQQRSAESTSRVNRSTAATQARLLAELKPQSEAVLLLEGELARGALYDPIDDCIKYYTPISEIEYEQMVDRWLEAFYSTFEHFSDEVRDGSRPVRALVAYSILPLLSSEICVHCLAEQFRERNPCDFSAVLRKLGKLRKRKCVMRAMRP